MSEGWAALLATGLYFTGNTITALIYATTFHLKNGKGGFIWGDPIAAGIFWPFALPSTLAMFVYYLIVSKKDKLARQEKLKIEKAKRDEELVRAAFGLDGVSMNPLKYPQPPQYEIHTLREYRS